MSPPGAHADEDDHDPLGIQAFRETSAGIERLIAALALFDRQHATRSQGAASAAERALVAAHEAGHAAGTALEAAQEARRASRAEIRTLVPLAALAALLGVLTAGGAAFWIGRSDGWDQGRAAGLAEARDEAAAAAWGATPAGRRALELDRLGSLALLEACAGKGWRRERRDGRDVCYPAPDERIAGWFVP